MTKLSTSLPKHHGLYPIDSVLVNEPHQTHVVIAVLDCKSTTIDNDTDDVEATARIRSVEVITDPDERARAHRLMERAREKRTGATVLPLDLEQQLDPSTGELRDSQS